MNPDKLRTNHRSLSGARFGRFYRGHLSGILIIDNAKGHKAPIYGFSGGPEHYGFTDNGKLISHSGPWKQGETADFGKWDGGGIILVNDDSPAVPWIERLKNIETEMGAQTDADYSPITAPWGNTGNSNSWASEVVKRAGLQGAYDRATRKRGSTPWVPGWGKDVWK